MTVSDPGGTYVLVPNAVFKGRKKLSGVGPTVDMDPVTPGGGVPTGQVTLEFINKQRNKVAVKSLETARLSTGEAILIFKPDQVLHEPLTIIYSGDPDFLRSCDVLGGQ